MELFTQNTVPIYTIDSVFQNDATFVGEVLPEPLVNPRIIGGSMEASELHIPNKEASANSFHSDNVGNFHWGCTAENFISDNDNAAAYILNTGVAKFQKVTIDGGANVIFISDTLNTYAKEILSDFDFGTTDYAGALKSGTIDWDVDGDNVTGSGVAVYRKGIIGSNDGTITFSVSATDGSATFAGTVQAAALIVGTAASLIETGATSNLPSDENLVGYWSFDEGAGSTANDGSGEGNNGTLHNMEAGDWVDGPAGGALDFGGTNEYIDISIDTTLNLTGNFSITLWLKYATADQGAGYPPLIKNQDGSSRISIQVDGPQDKIYFNVTDAAGNTTGSEQGSNLGDNAWHFVSLVRNGEDILWYEDGVLIKTKNVSGLGATAFTTDWMIAWFTAGNYYIGEIDEVRVYKGQVLTAKEIYALYKNPSGQPSLAVPIGRLTSGSIYSKQVTLAVTAGTGDSYIRGGNSFDMTNWRGDDAFILGLDDSDSDKAKFFIGNYTNEKYMKYVQGGDLDVVGGKIRTSISGARLELRDDKLWFYYASGWAAELVGVLGGIQIAGFLLPDGTNSRDLGKSDKMFRTLYLGTNEYINGDIYPNTDNSSSALGFSTRYFGQLYADYVGYKTTGAFESHDDIGLIKKIDRKVIKIRKPSKLNKNGVRTKGRETDLEVWDENTMPKEVYQDGFYNAGMVSGLLIGTLKQLISKVEKLENKLKQ